MKGRLASHRRMLLPAMGVAATLIVALVVVVGSAWHEDSTSSLAFRPAGPSTQSEVAAPAQDTATSAPPPSKPGTLDLDAASPQAAAGTAKRTVSRGFGRKVQRTTELALSTAADKLQNTADGVVKVTQAAGGVVENSQVDSDDTGGSATFTLSIPTARLDDTIKQLSALAHVSSMSQGATDITGSFVSVTDRLSDSRAERKALLKALGVAKTAERIATLKARLATNRSELASYKGELQSLRRRADNTTVHLTVIGSGKSTSSGGGGWSIGGAAGDALRVLEVVASVVLISAAILGPLAILAALLALSARAAGRRRRESALDAA